MARINKFEKIVATKGHLRVDAKIKELMQTPQPDETGKALDIENLEEAESITIDNYRFWLKEFILGLGGRVPNIEEWKIIKHMLDKVEQDEYATDDKPGWTEPVNPIYDNNLPYYDNNLPYIAPIIPTYETGYVTFPTFTTGGTIAGGTGGTTSATSFTTIVNGSTEVFGGAGGSVFGAGRRASVVVAGGAL